MSRHICSVLGEFSGRSSSLESPLVPFLGVGQSFCLEGTLFSAAPSGVFRDTSGRESVRRAGSAECAPFSRTSLGTGRKLNYPP